MQQRGSVAMDNAEETENSSATPPSSRTRHNSKLKVLVRSHAMREESPQRESPTNNTRNNFPSGNIATAEYYGTGTSPQVAVVLSPTMQMYGEERMRSPSREAVSPTTTSPMMASSPLSPVAVVLSPSASATSLKMSPNESMVFALSPKCLSPTNLMHSQTYGTQSQGDCCSPTTYSQTGENEENTESLHDGEHEQHLLQQESYSVSSNKHQTDRPNSFRISSTTSNNQSDIIVVNLKQTSHNNFRKNKYGSTFCDCQQNHPQNCLKCSKNSERNLAANNNNFNNLNNNMGGGSNPNMLSVSRVNSRGKLRQQSSSLGSFESSSNSPCLSRDSSSEQYTDTTGVDLEQFIPETLNRNAKDRALMLRIEQELVNLAKDKSKTHYKFPPMSSYQRMLVHRCAAYFGMDHNIEPTGKSVVVNKTKNTRIPDVEFKEHIKDDIIFSEEPRRSILKRDSSSIEDYSFKSPDRSFSMENRRSKSFEEREEEYEKVRRRIFNREIHDGSSEDFGWSEIPWSSTESDYGSRFRLQPPTIQLRQFGKLIKVHSEDPGETQRPCVAKSYSFGGYGGAIHVLTRGDSMMSTHSAGPRLLTKQDSGASSVSWRLSPSSSGYKSQSQMSESVTPSPTSTPHLVGASGDTNEVILSTEPGGRRQAMMDGSTAGGGETQIVWAVTDIQNVPKGSVIIDPHTGQPLKNEDGSTYQFDPNNPPPNTVQLSSKPPASPQKYKEPPVTSPKKPSRPSRSSPTPRKSNVMINSSTSPSLPALSSSPDVPPVVTSPVHHHSLQTAASSTSVQKRFTSGYVTPSDTCLSSGTVAITPQTFGAYPSGAGYGAATPSGGESTGVYQQPYYVYSTPYSTMHLQQQYEGRMEASAMHDVANTAFYISDATGAPPPGQPTAIAYHQTQPTQSYWNQPITFYQNSAHPATPTPPHQRYQQTPTGFVPTGYAANYLATAAPPQHTHPSPHNPELVPVYPNQPLQVVYHQSQPTPQSSIIYQNQPPIVYATHNSVYQSPGAATAAYPPPQMTPQHMAAQSVPPYPQGTPTPNSCSSSTSSHVFPGPPMQEPQPFMHLAQSMQSLSLTSGVPPQGILGGKGPQPFDYRQRQGGNNGFKNPNNGGKFGNNKNLMGSSQSSTGTNSPAATVIAAGFCPAAMTGQNPSGLFRTPPETPPAQFAYPPNFSMPPVMFKQVGNVRAATPVTARSSRSPTPAGDLPHYEKQRMTLPPNIYHGMPYVVPADPRFMQSRPQPMYRQPTYMNKPPIYGQGSDNRAHKNRKPKTNKQTGLPPSGK